MEINNEDIINGLQRLSENDNYKTLCKKYLRLKNLKASDFEGVKQILLKAVRDPYVTELVAKYFPAHLLWVLTESMNVQINKPNIYHKQNCLVLAKLVTKHPDVLKFSLQYFDVNPSPFNNELEEQVPHKRAKLNLKEYSVTDYDIVYTCWTFLKNATDQFKNKWDWSEFISLFSKSSDELTKWLYYQCIAVVLGISEADLNILYAKENINAQEVSVEFDRLQTNSFKAFETNSPVHQLDIAQEGLIVNIKSVVKVHDILLPKRGPEIEAPYPGGLISVTSTNNNLRSLALAVATGRPACLTGPVGSGKTSLVEHLSRVTGTKLIKVQLGEQTDSKMLLGSYRCTDVPGEFLWEAGVLTQAVISGDWLLLEDVDSATLDVSSVLAGLIETNTLNVPGYKDQIRVTPGFQLFLTQRLITSSTGFHKKSTGSSCLLEKNLLQVYIEPLSRSELTTVVAELFPVLTTISTRIVDVFLLFSLGSHDFEELGEQQTDGLALGSGRLTSTRDLIKWCCRMVQDFDVSSENTKVKILQDAIDVFCCSIVLSNSRLELAKGIAANLGATDNFAEKYCNLHKPSIRETPTELIVGRAKIHVKEEIVPLLKEKESSTYSFTNPSARLLERIASCIGNKEPVLLVGETGTGKTSSVQFLAEKTRRKLIVINMNQQSDSVDLLGGYKPVDLKLIIRPIRDEFEDLFRRSYDQQKNEKFLGYISKTFYRSDWNDLVVMMKKCQLTALKKLSNDSSLKNDSKKIEYLNRWQKLGLKIKKLELQLRSKASLAFSFIEGSLVKAIQNGDWVLLDEINLAPPETLECLSGLLEGTGGSLSLLERGDREPIKRHPDFTLFACMNPATDVGKKDLPPGLRNRFTEFYVDELTDSNDLIVLVSDYLRPLSKSLTLINNVVKLYLALRKESKFNLSDGTGYKPHYSLRTLCRALYISRQSPCGSLARSLYEGLCISFLTQLDNASHTRVESMIATAVLGKEASSLLGQPLPELSVPCIQFEGYWVPLGLNNPEAKKNYVLTQCVKQNLRDLARVVSIGKLPVLLQGDTSVGKTSLISYLARASGNQCVRINNHEHTDLQEYIGSYVADEKGALVFREGILVQAMRKGYWVILDELNLAPSDVLEALNRVLDDNRELFIPETQTTVRAHPGFMLFATQNPPGVYGGRKMLSRAFRNRFVELHFSEIPPNELQVILHKRCDVPESYCKKMIAVMTELQLKRRGSAACAGKQGFITLRDLFRWGERYRLAPNKIGVYDWEQHIADEGFLVLAGRVRQADERDIIQQVIKKHIKRTVDTHNLFTLHDKTSSVTRDILEDLKKLESKHFKHVVWTKNMRRLAVLIGKAFRFKEPVLLVGETGCGKTTVCQVLASRYNQNLKYINCHLHTEASDFLGGLRPTRDKKDSGLFEWVDGPLVEAMRNGDLFLADEISLADDSVLERLNSLLEPERRLLLSEKNIDESKESSEVTAAESFHFTATMNPAGDFGKKELSPALRNRFTEIWCDSVNSREDYLAIIEHNLLTGLQFGNQQDGSSGIGNCILNFIEWFANTTVGSRFSISVRDILTWVQFINTCSNRGLTLPECFVHGACLTFLDSLGSGVSASESLSSLTELRNNAVSFLLKQLEPFGLAVASVTGLIYDEQNNKISADISSTRFEVKPFYIDLAKKDEKMEVDEVNGDANNTAYEFSFTAPTTGMNTLRLLRGMQLGKAILLEGSPGVGKTSLVSAVAKATGHELLRINLSDQTDVSDLFGADLPAEGEKAGTFAWRDGPFLQALKQGHWILLDELNLAPQSVLEGLNACLDHRGEVFVPELGKVFHIKTGTRIFACQNPLKQGGARRGLPRSFLNRFTQVYIDSLSPTDLEFIATKQYPEIPIDMIKKMIVFNSRLEREISDLRLFGYSGSPWEMNLRDILRWCEALQTFYGTQKNINPGKFVDLIYIDRMRTCNDKERVKEIFYDIFGTEYSLCNNDISFYITARTAYIGDSQIQLKHTRKNTNDNFLILRKQLPILRLLSHCVNFNWMTILVGSSGTGKTSCVRLLAEICNRDLKIVSVNSAMDTTEILGGFEQTDYHRHLQEISEQVDILLKQILCKLASISSKLMTEGSALLRQWEQFQIMIKDTSYSQNKTTSEETKEFQNRISTLKNILDNMKICNNSDLIIDERINNMVKKLSTLAAGIEQENSLNAGGKFEWVDSVFVKCLIDGNWLLLDNVNLCSAAVLDRLNGLLEPNGYLTISERGVNSFGELVTIKPHPDFRLFLAMDPKHGEISRAMRNRGIEICILPDDNIDLLDQKSLLANVGLEQHGFQKILLQIHNSISEILPEYMKPTTSQLLHAGFLVSQQIHRGVSVKQALQLACADVYIKSKVDILQSSTKEQIKNLLDEVVFNTDNLSKQNTLVVNALTLNTTNITDNCRLSIVKQQLELFISFLKWSVDRTTTFEDNLHSIFPTEISYDNLDINELLSFMFLLSYQLTSERDMNIRSLYIDQVINQLIESNKDGQESNNCIIFKTLNKTICDLATRIGTFNRIDDLPIDFRFYPHISYFNSYDESYINKFTLLMYFNIVKSTEKSLEENVEKLFNEFKKSKTITVLEYSNAILSNKLSDVLDEPVVTYFFAIIKGFDKYITELLCDYLTILSTQEYFNIYSVLNFRFRLYKLGELIIIDRNNKKYDISKVIAELSVHYKWFIKYCITAFKSLSAKYDTFSNAVDEASSDLEDVLNKVAESLKTTIIPLQGIGARYKSVSGEVLPYNDLKQAELFGRYKNMSQMLSIWMQMEQIHINSTNSRVNFLCTAEGKRTRIQLSDIYNTLLENNFEKAEELLQVVEQKLNEKVNTNAVSISDQNQIKIQLWQVKEYYLLIFLNLYKRHLLGAIDSEEEIGKYGSLVKELTISQQQIPSHFASLVALQSPAKADINEILNSITQFSLKSTCILPNRFLLDNTADLLNEVPLSKYNPLLTRSIVEILSSSNKNLESLGMSYERRQQLIMLNKILWNNMILLKNYNSVIHDAKCTVKLFINFIDDLKETLNISDDYAGEDIITQCIENIDKLYENSGTEAQNEKSKITGIINQCSKNVTTLNFTIQNFNEEDDASQIKVLYNTAQIQMQLSFLKATLCCNLHLIDPIHKQRLKLKYTKEEKTSTSNYLLAGKMQHYILTGNAKYPEHVQFKKMLELQNKLISQEEDLEKRVAIRPVDSYSALAKDCLYLSKNLLSPSVVLELYNKLTSCVNILYQICYESKRNDFEEISKVDEALREISTWMFSLERFCDKLNSNYDNSYPDITRPLMATINGLIEGISNFKYVITKLSITKDTLSSEKNEMINSLMCFPILNDKQTSIVNIVDNLTSQNMYNLLLQNVNKDVAEAERHRILLICLEELKNHCIASNNINNSWSSLKNIFEMLVISWKKQEENREQKKIDEDNLYVTKTKCEQLTEEETIQNEIQELFPSFDNEDFSDFKKLSLNATKTKEIVKPSNNLVINLEDIKSISVLHMELMTSFTKCEWIIPSKVEIKKDYLGPLTQRYQTFQLIINNLVRGLDNNLDKNLVASLNILTTATLKNAEGVNMAVETPASPTRSKFDFYSESKVEEAKRGLSILQTVLVGIEKQLEEWPEHPVLNDVVIIIKRILSFSVTSPLARFLTGVELLRDKVEEWNKNAHRGNNLQPESLELAQLIVDWRKLELNCWRDSLNNVLEKMKSGAHKYWFHVYSLIEQYIDEHSDNAISFDELSTALKQFLERSTLGEYTTRLNFIYVFHCHATYLNPSAKRAELIALLWNLYNYYSQFIPNVETRIKDQRTPIEKKLRDFVKITSWEKDLSYWGVKDRVDKAHKALHKHIREFKECLEQSVISSLVDNKTGDDASIGIWDRPHRQSNQYQYMVEPLNYVANIKLKRFVSAEHKSDKNLINKMLILFGKARNLCKDTILSCSYPCRLQSLDTLLTEIIETSTHLRNLEVSSDLPKPKQKSQAKSILQQKRKALSDLFRGLSRLGLSHRTGLHQANLKDHVLSDFSIAPVDIEAAFSYLKIKKCDGPLLTVWEGCEMYYVRSVARYAALNTAIKSPAQDLGIQNIERFRGFSADLLLLAQAQKTNLAENSQVLCSLRKQINQLLSLEEEFINHPKQSVMQNSYEKLKDILITSATVMEQFELVLKSCPEENLFDSTDEADEMCIDSALCDLPMLKCRKNDGCWSETMQHVKGILSCVAKIQNTIDKNDMNLPMVYQHNSRNILNIDNFKFISPMLFEIIIDCFDQLSEISSKVQTIYKKFGDDSLKHPLCTSLYWLDSLIQSETSAFKQSLLDIESPTETPNDCNEYNTQVDSLINSMLLSIQNLYKKYNNTEKDTTEPDASINGTEETVPEADLEEWSEIEEKHLKELIHNQLNEDINILNLPLICNRLQVLIQTVISTQESNTATYKISLKSLLRCVPLLEQLVLLSQFYLTQQVAAHRLTCKILSILLNIFMELTTKGFCVPPDLLEEQSDGIGNQSGGLGLGEGEGERDVSDRIENEDQLDDAQQKGQEKEKDGDKDCKEEEKGIEMSEDFDSKLQDVDSKDDENESDKEDEDDTDADKQMGDTDRGAEKLDEQIWGSDNEEDAEDQNEDASDGTGKETGEKEMTANENQPNSAGNEEEAEPDTGSEENKKDKQKKDIDKMEEPEMNDEQIDPYHGNMEPPPEPEALDLPDDLQLDEGDAKPEQDGNEENPFDIDTMKEQMPPPEQEEETNDKDENGEGNDDSSKMDHSDSSDEEDNTAENKPDDEENNEEVTPEDDNMETETTNTANTEEKKQEDTEEEPKEEEQKEVKEQNASASKDTATDQPEAQAMETGEECSSDQVQSNAEQTQKSGEESEPKEKTEKDAGSDGQAENKDPESGHQGDATSNQQVTSQKESNNRVEKKEKKRKPGETDSERTLGEVNEPLHKKLKTIDLKHDSNSKEDEKEEEGIADEAQEKSADLYKHIKDAKSSDTQMLDAATAEQAEANPVPNENPDEEVEELKDDDVEMHEDEHDAKEDEIEQLNSDNMEEANVKDKIKNNKSQTGDPNMETENVVEIEGEKILTMTAERESDTSYHTSHDVLKDDFNMEIKMNMGEIQAVKHLVSQKLLESSQIVDSTQNSDWDSLWWRTSNQARDLCEQLRLVLEPTLSSRLKGDYRSGRRINMRKVIPYVASEFRKDKIWLRRTKPSKREYRIIVAIDDSSSMDGNQSTELACESLALVSQALSLLETGDLSVISFGESPKILHPFGQSFTSQNGAKIMNELTFKQNKSRFSELLNFSGALFRDHSSGNGAELLIIVSDGRIVSEGYPVVNQAVRRLRQAGIFIVFLIIDNNKSNSSLVDTRVPIFNERNQLVGLKSSMDLFPFPFYLFLRDLNSLPTVLSDALRQWFELVTNKT